MTSPSADDLVTLSDSSARQDAAVLLALLEGDADTIRRTPWTWSALSDQETQALMRTVQRWVDDYNTVHAVTHRDTIPACWFRHPGLAHDLAVMVWVYFDAHHHRRSTPLTAGDYHLRYLPGFRSRLDHLLGGDPAGCRADRHPASWRSSPGEALHPADRTRHERATEQDHGRGAAFGFDIR